MYYYPDNSRFNSLNIFINMKFEKPKIIPTPKSSFNWKNFKNPMHSLKEKEQDEKYIIIDTINNYL